MSTASMGSLRYFRDHLSLYQKQAEDEQWKGDHEDAMKCRDLEEFISIGLGLFNSMKERAYAVQDAIARGSLGYDPDISQAFIDGYKQWMRPCATVERAIRAFESRGYQVDKADEFRGAVEEITLHDFDIDAMIKAKRDIREGRGKPLAEAISELQRDCQSKCV
jgi:hypothetical protein